MVYLLTADWRLDLEIRSERHRATDICLTMQEGDHMIEPR